MADEAAIPELVFLHGWTMEGGIFGNVVGLLGDRFACHAPDLPGHGDAGAGHPPTIDGCADFVADYLARNGIRRPVLIGWSLGAMVAWNVRRRHRDVDIAGIISIDMSPRIVNGPGWQFGIRNFEARQNERMLAAIRSEWKAFAARVNSGMYAAGSSEPHPDTLEMIRRKDPSAMRALWASLSQSDERETLASLDCPLLVIKGMKSRLYPAETGAWIAARAQRGALVGFERSGHSPHLEEPELFVETLVGWMRGLSSPPTSLLSR